MLASEQTRTATQRSRVAVLVFMYDRLPACRWYGQEIRAEDREVPSMAILVSENAGWQPAVRIGTIDDEFNCDSMPSHRH